MQKLSINLLQSDLLPKQVLWTLKRVVTLWVFALVLMLSWMYISQYQHQQLNA